MSDNQSDNWDTWCPKKETMTNDDLPPLPKAVFYISNGETWNSPYYNEIQMHAVQREAYEVGKRRAALNTVHAIDRELINDPLVLLSRDEARLALWKAINKRSFGNPTDDKLVLDDLKRQGLWICKIDNQTATASAAPTLTDEEIADIWTQTDKNGGVLVFARAIEAAIHTKLIPNSVDLRETSQHSTDFGPSWRAGEA
jgi:hypothetical protein